MRHLQRRDIIPKQEEIFVYNRPAMLTLAINLVTVLNKPEINLQISSFWSSFTVWSLSLHFQITFSYINIALKACRECLEIVHSFISGWIILSHWLLSPVELISCSDSSLSFCIFSQCSGSSNNFHYLPKQNNNLVNLNNQSKCEL